MQIQPPSGGCVLKPINRISKFRTVLQPPSGGCVLKPPIQAKHHDQKNQPPSGGCVLKPGSWSPNSIIYAPAAFRRLCVETVAIMSLPAMAEASRLQAAVC